ncbi:anti-sigma factor [Exiguobacterium acetylicum]|uniref:anti-sigma factor n=1 Tax=Exiguobacterium TaxID=33986 RepID=UPI0027E12B33|nr:MULTISPECIES: anti-sigma factor [Exiguobacterium]MDQ6468311.1 anti-sigma factor [Exiguobacterium acetylicum]
MSREHVHERIQDYLDQNQPPEEFERLEAELREADAMDEFEEYRLLDARLRQLPAPKLSADFTSRVLAQLPDQVDTPSAALLHQPQPSRFGGKMKQYPLLAAAAVFLLLSIGSLGGYMAQEEHDLSYTNAPGIVAQNGEVVVPKGVTVDQDLYVEGGNVRIEGKVNGDVMTVDGKAYTASAGSVTGEIKEIDQLFERVWYGIKRLFQ